VIGYFLYALLAVGLTLLLSASFRRLRRDDEVIVAPDEDEAFNRRMEAIEQQYRPDATDRCR
jgi:hypothetical protein